jgi:hypothetical protein
MFLAYHQFYIADSGCSVEMCVYNIRLELEMEIEQRDVVSCFHRKGMKLPATVARLFSASVSDD